MKGYFGAKRDALECKLSIIRKKYTSFVLHAIAVIFDEFLFICTFFLIIVLLSLMLVLWLCSK